MKITIDTEQKTITVDGNVSLSELMDRLNDMFPDEEWKEYDLEEMVEERIVPTYIERDRYPWREPRPFYYDTETLPEWWQDPVITYSGSGNEISRSLDLSVTASNGQTPEEKQED